MPEHDKTRTYPAGRVPAAGPGTILMAMALVASGFFLAPGSSPHLFASPPQEEKKAPAVGKVIKLKVRPAQVKENKGAEPQLKEAVKALQKAITGEKTKPKSKAASPPATGGKVRRSAPAPPMFHMRDGTRLAGVPQAANIQIKTVYGLLTVPMSELVKIRFCSSLDSGLSEKITKLIQQLGHEEFDLREDASEQLEAIGVPALKALEAAQKSEDEEIKARAEKLVARLDESVEEPDESDIHLVPLEGEEDEIETLEFTIKGKIEEKSFLVKTRYGSLDFNRSDILSIVFQEPLVTKLSFDVPGNTFAEKNKWFDSQADLAEGEEFKLRSSGTIILASLNGTKCGPDGTRSVNRASTSSTFKGFPTGSLVGKIGKTGKPFLVGSDYSGVVEKKGRLFLGMALSAGVVQGKIKVVLEKRPGSSLSNDL